MIEFMLVSLLQGQPDDIVPAYECNRTYATEAMCQIAEIDVASRYDPPDNVDLATACVRSEPTDPDGLQINLLYRQPSWTTWTPENRAGAIDLKGYWPNKAGRFLPR